MAGVSTITDILNLWVEWGVFSYVIPFLLIFAVVFAILEKTKLFNRDDKQNKGIEAIIAVAVALLSLLNDHVPLFFEQLFPRFGIGLSIFLVLVILIGFFFQPTGENGKPMSGAIKWIGWLTGIGVVIWAWSAWDDWGAGGLYGVGSWFSQYIWSLIILGTIIGIVIWIAKSGEDK